jgi:hypothetical protein
VHCSLAKIEASSSLNTNDNNIDLIESHQQQLFKKLLMLGLRNHHEKQLLVLKEQIFKQHSNRQQCAENEPAVVPFRGLYNLKELQQILPRSESLIYESVSQPLSASNKNKRSSNKVPSNQLPLNQEWGLMFSDASIQINQVSPTLSKRNSTKLKDTVVLSKIS